jgi:beta-lactamase regulating signal transducer with metallopeptidase domain
MFDITVRLIENSAVMSVAVVVLYVLARLTRNKIAPKVRYACWILVAVGLLLPVRPALLTIPLPESLSSMATVSLMPNAAPGLSARVERIPETDIYGNVIDGVYWEGNAEGFGVNYGASDVESENSSTGVLTADGLIICDSALGTCGFHAGVLSADGLTTDCLTTGTSLSFSSPLSPTIPPTTPNEPPTPNNQPLHWRFILPTLWGIGALFFLFVCAVRHIRFIKKIHRWAVPCSDAVTNHLLDDVCRELGLRHIPQLLICPLTATPIITGLTHPVLILPDTKETPNRLKLIILHEALHIKRFDNWVRVLSLAATAVHWFNPLVYLMNRALHTEAELACDSDVLRYAGDEARAEYSRAIFKTALRTQKLRSVLASALTGEGKNLKDRLRNIIERKHTRRGLAVFLAVVMIGGVLVAGMLNYENRNPVAEDDPEPTDVEEYTVPVHYESSNQLVIYIPGYREFNRRFLQALTVFRLTYPDVELIVERIGGREDASGNAYMQRVRAELMADKGTDIILTHYFDDIQMTMEGGIFLDLTPFWNNDADFAHKSQLHPVVMDAGLYRGKRYVIPLSYNMVFYLGERRMLDRLGFDLNQDMDILSFYTRLYEILPLAYQDPMFQTGVEDLFYYVGTGWPIPFVDFERGTPLPEEEILRAFMEMYGNQFRYTREHMDRDVRNQVIEDSSGMEALLMSGMDMFFASNFPVAKIVGYNRLRALGFEPVIFALPDHNGEYTATVSQSVAVRANSPNHVNAWNFIKILLSESIQDDGRDIDFWSFEGIAVNNAAAAKNIEKLWDLYFSMSRHEAGGAAFAPARSAHQHPLLFIDLLNSITQVTLPNRRINTIFDDLFIDYLFRGRLSLDDIMEEMRRTLRIYLSE